MIRYWMVTWTLEVREWLRWSPCSKGDYVGIFGELGYDDDDFTGCHQNYHNVSPCQQNTVHEIQNQSFRAIIEFVKHDIINTYDCVLKLSWVSKCVWRRDDDTLKSTLNNNVKRHTLFRSTETRFIWPDYLCAFWLDKTHSPRRWSRFELKPINGREIALGESNERMNVCQVKS